MDELDTDDLSEHLSSLRKHFIGYPRGTILTPEAMQSLVQALDLAIDLSKLQFNELNTHRALNVSASNIQPQNEPATRSI